MKRVEELTLQWIDGVISQADAGELYRLLDVDPAARQVHVECCELEAALRSRVEDFDVVESTMARVSQGTSEVDGEILFEIPVEWYAQDDPLRRSHRRTSAWRAALATSLLLVTICGGVAYLVKPLELMDARMGPVDPRVTVTRDNKSLTAEMGLMLRTGDIVNVPASAVASIHYNDGTRVVLGSNSQAILTELTRFNAASKNLALKSGNLTAHVAKQQPGKSMLVTTPTARFRVLGTRFTLAADASSARLDVIEGRVHAERRDNAASVDVEQGQFAVADLHTPLKVQSIPSRAVAGLIALYRFDEGRGTVVHDVSRVGAALDLHIDRAEAVEWSPGGGLMLREPAIIASTKPARKIAAACRATGELTVEAWVVPSLARQSGPARIVTMSSDPSHRNFTLGHGGDPDELPGEAHRSYFIGRVRTSKTTKNGIPDLPSHNDSVAADLAHVVYTRTKDGLHHLYVDGIERSSAKRPGDFSSWDEDYRLALGDEFTRDRPWQGELLLVAVFSRALSRDDMLRNFRAGPGEKRRESGTSK
ncbi:MAG: FecR domain-containing protein [Planctomycetia bacterium]|nr:FecR domain-containing protein [Planctomycetia bacterium]